jgi:hypothetical protein
MDAHQSRRVIEWQLISNLNQTRIRTSFHSITVKEDVRCRYRFLYEVVTYWMLNCTLVHHIHARLPYCRMDIQHML